MNLKPKALLPVIAMLYLALIAFTPDAAAYCGPPRIKLSVAHGERGAILTVEGLGFWKECFDVGPGAQVPPSTTPARGIKVICTQGGQSTVLATVDADAILNFSLKVAIPSNASIGNATFTASGDMQYPVNPRLAAERFKPWEAGFE